MMWLMMIIILGVVFGSTFLIKRLVPEGKLGAWANVASIVGGIATAISLLWASYTFFESARFQRELSAYSIYQEHMKISMEKPYFANAELTPKPPNENSSKEDKEKYEAYQWYVGHALYSFESILAALPNDAEWEKTFAAFIKDHKEYIGSDFPCDRYEKSIERLMEKNLGKGCLKQP